MKKRGAIVEESTRCSTIPSTIACIPQDGTLSFAYGVSGIIGYRLKVENWLIFSSYNWLLYFTLWLSVSRTLMHWIVLLIDSLFDSSIDWLIDWLIDLVDVVSVPRAFQHIRPYCTSLSCFSQGTLDTNDGTSYRLGQRHRTVLRWAKL